jgi:hypothetical protein
MAHSGTPTVRRLATLVATALLGSVLSLVSAVPAHAATTPLNGLFRLTAGAQSGAGAATGSYFRMIQPGGTLAAGPFLANADSAATDKTYTLFTPGTDGGLISGIYQPQPATGFDSGGNSLSGRLIVPTAFFGVKFGISTNATDLQTGGTTALPTISVNESGQLSGDLRALDASWNNQQFNQGSPKPDGSHPGLTADLTGTYNSSTRAFSIDWSSLIVGGPFNGFTGKWHLEGTFVANPPPTFNGYSRTATGYSVKIANYDATTTYTVVASLGTVTRSGSKITVSGLTAGKTSKVTVTAKKTSFTDAVGSYTGKSLNAGTTPKLSTPAKISKGFTVKILNYSSAVTYTQKTSAGKVKRSGSKVTVYGLTKGKKATVTVTAKRTGYTTKSASKTGTAG